MEGNQKTTLIIFVIYGILGILSIFVSAIALFASYSMLILLIVGIVFANKSKQENENFGTGFLVVYIILLLQWISGFLGGYFGLIS